MKRVELGSVDVPPRTTATMGRFCPATGIAATPDGSVYVLVSDRAESVQVFRIEGETAEAVQRIPSNGREPVLLASDGALDCAFLYGGLRAPLLADIWRIGNTDAKPHRELRRARGPRFLSCGGSFPWSWGNDYLPTAIAPMNGNGYLIVGWIDEIKLSKGSWLGEHGVYQKYFAVEWEQGEFGPYKRLDGRGRFSAHLRHLVPAGDGLTTYSLFVRRMQANKATGKDILFLGRHTAGQGWAKDEVVHARTRSRDSRISSSALGCTGESVCALWTVSHEGVYSARRDSGGWTDPEPVLSGPDEPVLATCGMAPDGACHVLVLRKDSLFLMSRVNGRWESLRLVDREDTPTPNRPDMAVDSKGRVHVAYLADCTGDTATAVYECYEVGPAGRAPSGRPGAGAPKRLPGPPALYPACHLQVAPPHPRAQIGAKGTHD
ncbi:MAG: hypothetical protein JXR94_07565 [Candidatus Hydrogenedentes bacterium]|nr:hypothetical protein [Candidatus Hydrogenedentota bacterium]